MCAEPSESSSEAKLRTWTVWIEVGGEYNTLRADGPDPDDQTDHLRDWGRGAVRVIELEPVLALMKDFADEVERGGLNYEPADRGPAEDAVRAFLRDHVRETTG